MSIINWGYGFAFVHVPKAGGTSMSAALAPLCTWRDLQLGGTEFGEQLHRAYGPAFGLRKHSFATELRNVVGHSDWQRLTSFALVRHPVARVVSTYQYLSLYPETYAFMKDVKTFAEFLHAPFWKQDGPDRMFLPQSSWLFHPFKTDVQ